MNPDLYWKISYWGITHSLSIFMTNIFRAGGYLHPTTTSGNENFKLFWYWQWNEIGQILSAKNFSIQKIYLSLKITVISEHLAATKLHPSPPTSLKHQILSGKGIIRQCHMKNETTMGDEDNVGLLCRCSACEIWGFGISFAIFKAEDYYGMMDECKLTLVGKYIHLRKTWY